MYALKPAGVFHPGEFTGETHSWRIADAVLSEVRHYHAKAVPVHRHSAPYFSLLLDGSYEESSDDFSIA